MKTTTAASAIALPSPLTEADVTRKHYTEFPGKTDQAKYNAWSKAMRDDPTIGEFTMHYTERFGWVIATLHISSATRRHRAFNADAQDRTYAISFPGGQLCRVGLGPHIKRTAEVLIRKSRLAALQPLLDMQTKGRASAGDIRDSISTRRARTAARRFCF